jgi:PPK2 family polyphosphate:nucleotide phosphotransferase
MPKSSSIAVSSKHLVPFGKKVRLTKWDTSPSKQERDKDAQRKRLEALTEELDDLQRRLFADARHSLLLHIQGMDASGKDGTIRAVMHGIDAAGCEVSSFKKPSLAEVAHDFLWRTAVKLPERGRIGIHNRGYYEEVLIVRLRPEWLAAQKIDPNLGRRKAFWEERFESINDHEKHLARNGTAVVKIFLHLSKDEQKRRFLSRLEKPHKHWKFNEADVAERERWDDYQVAYQEAITATHKPWAPWYIVPADVKPYAWSAVADILVKTLRKLNPRYPTLNPEELKRFADLAKRLQSGN